MVFCKIFSTFRLNVRNVQQNIVNPTLRCYGYEYCYANHLMVVEFVSG